MEKIDVLDFLISSNKQMMEDLDKLINKLENIIAISKNELNMEEMK